VAAVVVQVVQAVQAEPVDPRLVEQLLIRPGMQAQLEPPLARQLEEQDSVAVIILDPLVATEDTEVMPAHPVVMGKYTSLIHNFW
jgi:hypothetical protein